MFLLEWYREFLSIKHENKVCESCETLRRELEIAHHEKQLLIDALNPKQVVSNENTNVTQMRPKRVPWSVRRNELEIEARREAQLKARKNEEMSKPTVVTIPPIVAAETISIEELEKELGVVEEIRENAGH
jgi:hypothetical protein